jgi:hypothetical protein
MGVTRGGDGAMREGEALADEKRGDGTTGQKDERHERRWPQ